MRLPSSCVAVLAGLCLGAAAALPCQLPVTRSQAVAAALTRGARVALAGTDTAAARGFARTARAFPNPLLSAGYSKSTPQHHALVDLPLDLPWLRSARIGTAEFARDAVRYGFGFERAAVRFSVDTQYTRALAATAQARLSQRTARDADSLARIAQLRQELGDASELDVQLAAVNAGQLENVAVADSLTAVEALIELQLAMGLPGDEVTITLADSLVPPATETTGAGGEPFLVAAAAATLHSQERAVALAHRMLLGAPNLQIGVETHDPSGGEPGLLPTIGLSFPLPLFNWNGGEVAQAAAARERARTELELVRRAATADAARARRELAAARARVERDARLLASADRVAALSLRAYGEGAVELAGVLEAQRNAREALARYIDDLAAANVAAAAVEFFTAAPGGGEAP